MYVDSVIFLFVLCKYGYLMQLTLHLPGLGNIHSLSSASLLFLNLLRSLVRNSTSVCNFFVSILLLLLQIFVILRIQTVPVLNIAVSSGLFQNHLFSGIPVRRVLIILNSSHIHTRFTKRCHTHCNVFIFIRL